LPQHDTGVFFLVNSYWGISHCERAQPDTIYIYSFNSVTNTVQTRVDGRNGYDNEKMRRFYYDYVFWAYGEPKKILVYAPCLDLWTTLPLNNTSDWSFGGDFVNTYDINDGNLKVFDVLNNSQLQFPFGWQSSYNFSKYSYVRDKFFIASNTDGHYFGFSSYTRDIKEYVADYYNSTLGNGMVAVMYRSFYGRDLMAYNAWSNSFIPLELNDEQGDSRNIWIGDSTALVTTQHGHLLAFDPYPEATAVKDLPGDKKYLPEQIHLGQNYPNPFNPITTIEFQIPGSRFVSLNIYNIRGQKVATLVNKKQGPGKHKITFDARGLASGVYIYKLEAGKFTAVRKMILMR